MGKKITLRRVLRTFFQAVLFRRVAIRAIYLNRELTFHAIIMALLSSFILSFTFFFLGGPLAAILSPIVGLILFFSRALTTLSEYIPVAIIGDKTRGGLGSFYRVRFAHMVIYGVPSLFLLPADFLTIFSESKILMEIAGIFVILFGLSMGVAILWDILALIFTYTSALEWSFSRSVLVSILLVPIMNSVVVTGLMILLFNIITSLFLPFMNLPLPLLFLLR